MVCLLALADPQFIARQNVASYDDGSSTGRLEGWSQAGRILWDHPFGTGARGFHLLIPKYSSVLAERHNDEPRAPHNTIVLVMVEYGIQGIVLWLLLIGALFMMLMRTRRLALATKDDFIYYRTVAVTVALISALIGSMFTDRLYCEGIYWMMALGLALNRLAENRYAELSLETKPLVHAA
jgi:O-antigen ligase